ncbi:protein FATTY ACID EXPORT 2, chloroplastic-like [Telopea speciosissima]|uniref:protein FATTY ACID EXPORT 2, chloroplastic-like n=1 Tax=Telopea speciosissima TaxID=54955 RepID=UPI001CC5DCB3|nr:protein FATTY ACID EXPORT 2, chloroplastic-like [Telopea speciosissima]
MAESSVVYSKSFHLLTHAGTSVSARRRSSRCYPISLGCLNQYRSSSGNLLHSKTFAKQQLRPSEIIRVVAGSDVTPLIPESTKEEFEFPLDTSGGDGFGGSGGGGGGDGGDDENRGGNEGNNNEGEGDSNRNENNKTMAMSMSQKLTLVYAALVGVGGVIGYLRRGSQKSLAAGGLAVLLLYYVYTELPVRPAFASSLGLGLSAVLLGVMGSRFKKSGKIFPAGVVSLLSLIMAGGYLHGFLRSMHG